MRKNDMAARGGLQSIKRVGGTGIMRSRKFWVALSLFCAAATLGCNSTPSNVVITLSQTLATVVLNQQQQFTATVTGTTNTGVTWYVTGSTGSAVAGGNT